MVRVAAWRAAVAAAPMAELTAEVAADRAEGMVAAKVATTAKVVVVMAAPMGDAKEGRTAGRRAVTRVE